MAAYTFIAKQDRSVGVYTSATILVPSRVRIISATVNSTVFTSNTVTLTLEVDVSNDSGATWNTIFSCIWIGRTSGRTDGWSGSCDFSRYAGWSVRVRLTIAGASLNVGLTGEIA
jgi:hypothetical protein